MFKEFSNNDKDDDYLSEFRQKIATQQQEDFLERQSELQRSRNGFIGTLAGIVLAAIVSWVLLMPKFSGNQEQEIPVIRRPIAPVKIQPNEPGGMEILNQDKSVYDLVEKREIAPEKIESILPEPEAPKMPTIVPEQEQPAQPEADQPETSTPSTQQPSDTPKEDENELPIKPIKENLAPSASTSGQAINIPQKIEEIKVAVKTVEPKEEPVKPAAVKPAETKTLNDLVSEVQKTPAGESSKETVKEVKKEVAATAAKGVWQVQLIASSNKKAVETAWKDLSASHSVLNGLPHEIESSENGGLYRLKAGAFATRDEADKVCGTIKKSGGSCLVKQK